MYFKAPGELWNLLSQSVSGNCLGSGRNSNRNCLQDWVDFHRSWERQFCLFFYTAHNSLKTNIYRYENLTVAWNYSEGWGGIKWPIENNAWCLHNILGQTLFGNEHFPSDIVISDVRCCPIKWDKIIFSKMDLESTFELVPHVFHK